MTGLKENAYNNAFAWDCFDIYILVDKKMEQKLKQVKICVLYKWQIFFIFSLQTFEI